MEAALKSLHPSFNEKNLELEGHAPVLISKPSGSSLLIIAVRFGR